MILLCRRKIEFLIDRCDRPVRGSCLSRVDVALDHRDLAVPTTSIKQANKHVEDVMSKGKKARVSESLYICT